MSAQKEKMSNTKAYNNAADDPIFRTRQSVHSKEDKYEPSKYSVVYNTLNEKPEDPILMSKSKDKSELQKNNSQEKFAPERQTKSSQSHLKFKTKEAAQSAETLSEGFGNKTIKESSELHMTVDFKDNKGLLSVINISVNEI